MKLSILRRGGAPAPVEVGEKQLSPDGIIDRRVFRSTVIVIATLAAAYAIWRLADLLLLVFACGLFGLIFFNLAKVIADRTPLNFALSLTVAVIMILTALTGAFWFFGNSLAGEFAELGSRLPAAYNQLLVQLQQSPVGRDVIKRAAEFAPSGQTVVNWVTTFVTSLGTILSAVAIVIIGGIYLAAQPRLYGRGVVILTPEAARGKLIHTFIAVAKALNAWLLGQGIGMIFVGVATTIGLSIIGLPAAPAIGLIAGLCEFVPYLGTIVVVIPSVILGFSESTSTGIWTLVVLIAVQQIQGNLVMPLLQSKMVELPPVLTIFGLVAAGVLLGPVGVILATPLIVVAMVVVKSVYVQSGDLKPKDREELDKI